MKVILPCGGKGTRARGIREPSGRQRMTCGLIEPRRAQVVRTPRSACGRRGP